MHITVEHSTATESLQTNAFPGWMEFCIQLALAIVNEASYIFRQRNFIEFSRSKYTGTFPIFKLLPFSLTSW